MELARDGGVDPCTVGVAADNCAPDAICSVVNNTTFGTAPICVGLPLCGEDGGCPSGAVSRGCNLLADGGQIVQGKAPVCLLSQCFSDADCISAAVCDNPGDGGPGKCRCVITTADAGPCAP